MTPPKPLYDRVSSSPSPVLREGDIESGFIGTFQGLNHEYRPDITDRATFR